MAADFIGSTVLVTLFSPPQGQVRGIVTDIVEQQLRLCNVTWLASGRQSLDFQIESTNIADLEVVPEPPPTESQGKRRRSTLTTLATTEDGILPSPSPGLSPAPAVPSPAPSPRTQLPSFNDPAILSLGKKPASTPKPNSLMDLNISVSEDIALEVVEPTGSHVALGILSKPLVPVNTKPRQSTIAIVNIAKHDPVAAATLSEPFNDLSLRNGPSQEDVVESEAAELGTYGGSGRQTRMDQGANITDIAIRQASRKTRRGTRGGKVRNGTNGPYIQTTLDKGNTLDKGTSPSVTKSLRNSVRPDVRQTPVVEADASTIPSPVGYGAKANPRKLWKPNRRDRLQAGEAQNGWATEDATDIQEMGDFDFEGNLSKFNKREVFDQLRKKDTTADEARLVSHNRLPRAGTAGGKNLHWNENVLSSPKVNGQAKWTSDRDSSDDRISSGKSSKRNFSRAALRRPPSRKGSAKDGETQSATAPKLVLTASLGSVRYSSFDMAGSPKPTRNMSTSPYGSVTSSRPSLRIVGSNKLCACLSPLQMLEYEQFATSELGLTDEILTENAGRGIAESTSKAIQGLDNIPNHNERMAQAFIIIVAGNHKSGARAVAAGRHLRNHGFRVVLTIMGLEREDDLLDGVRLQMNAYRKAGGNLLRLNELLDGLKGGNLRPTLLIDALLGTHTYFEDLRREEQAFYFELVLWVNRSDIEILSVDVPSGLDAVSGEVTMVEGNPLVLSPRYIVCLGAPKSWLLTMLKDAGARDATQLFLADIGISNVAWKRLGSRRNPGINFGSEWVVRLRYQGSVE